MAVSDHVDLDQFMAGVKKRNPGQTEFIQAVQEVAQDIYEFIDDKVEYHEAQILRRVQERNASGASVEKAINTTGVIELGFLERGLVVLATIANVAPLMGFLGTVAGMISAFGAIAEAGQVEASLVAGGIKVALITTATGLIIAVPVNIGYNFFVTRIDKLIVDMEEGTGAVLRMIWGMEGGDMAPATAGGTTPARPVTRKHDVAESIHEADPKQRPFTDAPEHPPEDTQID